MTLVTCNTQTLAFFLFKTISNDFTDVAFLYSSIQLSLDVPFDVFISVCNTYAVNLVITQVCFISTRILLQRERKGIINNASAPELVQYSR